MARSSQNATIEASETYLQDISTVEGVNEATRRLNSIVNEMRKRGKSDVRVAVVEVDQEPGDADERSGGV